MNQYVFNSSRYLHLIVALDITDEVDGFVVQFTSADVQSHHPVRIQGPHQIKIVHHTMEVPRLQLSPETERHNFLIQTTR